jgi:hypothetical protein
MAGAAIPTAKHLARGRRPQLQRQRGDDFEMGVMSMFKPFRFASHILERPVRLSGGQGDEPGGRVA